MIFYDDKTQTAGSSHSLIRTL